MNIGNDTSDCNTTSDDEYNNAINIGGIGHNADASKNYLHIDNDASSFWTDNINNASSNLTNNNENQDTSNLKLINDQDATTFGTNTINSERSSLNNNVSNDASNDQFDKDALSLTDNIDKNASSSEHADNKYDSSEVLKDFVGHKADLKTGSESDKEDGDFKNDKSK